MSGTRANGKYRGVRPNGTAAGKPLKYTRDIGKGGVVTQVHVWRKGFGWDYVGTWETPHENVGTEHERPTREDVARAIATRETWVAWRHR